MTKPLYFFFIINQPIAVFYTDKAGLFINLFIFIVILLFPDHSLYMEILLWDEASLTKDKVVKSWSFPNNPLPFSQAANLNDLGLKNIKLK